MLLYRVDRWRTWASLSVTLHTRTNVSFTQRLSTNASSKVNGGGILAGREDMFNCSACQFCSGRPRVQSVISHEPLFCTISTDFPTFDVIETTSIAPHTLSPPTTNQP